MVGQLSKERSIKMKIATVNVVEIADDSIIGIRSFSDNEEGNKEAETLFVEYVKENGDNISDEEMEVFIEDGYFEQGSYLVVISHSN